MCDWAMALNTFSFSLFHTNSHAPTHTHTLTRTHTSTLTYTHTLSHTHTHPHSHTHTHSHTHPHSHTHTHTHSHTHTHTHHFYVLAVVARAKNCCSKVMSLVISFLCNRNLETFKCRTLWTNNMQKWFLLILLWICIKISMLFWMKVYKVKN